MNSKKRHKSDTVPQLERLNDINNYDTTLAKSLKKAVFEDEKAETFYPPSPQKKRIYKFG